jgi:hypothetical protein
MRAFPYLNLVFAKISFTFGLTLSLCAPIYSHAADVSEKPAHKLTAVESSPTWADLSLAQKKALLPLENLWPTLEVNRKRKWLAVAQNFVNMNEASQALAQERMREWAALSPLQRTQARLNFAQTKQLSGDEKLAKWEAYQALPESKKQALLEAAPKKPAGAAVAVKPVAANKLAAVPVTRKTPEPVRAIALQSAAVDRYTLLRQNPATKEIIQAPAPVIK